MRVEISIRNVQAVREIQFLLDLEKRTLICLTGKNGAGKTTLIKAIRNLVNANTFPKTSSADSVNESSTIEYNIDGLVVKFVYNEKTKFLDSKETVPDVLRKSLSVELPIPHGERFNFFQRVSSVDSDLRAKIVSREFSPPEELIGFLGDIYPSKNFDDLVQINHRGVPYYCRVSSDLRYTREDYLSSGEYFLIGLYRRISAGCKAIVVDEVDISLDAAAQVKLIGWLRKFQEKYQAIFLITTHSLAMMRTLSPEELFYLEEGEDGVTRAKNVSYNYVKSVLYGFRGWDRYILTEDDVLRDFLGYVINKKCIDTFYRCKIIYIGGGSNTTDLLLRNSQEEIFSEPENVIAILDGDQRKLKHAKRKNVYCIPMESVEKELLTQCLNGELVSSGVLNKYIKDPERLRTYFSADGGLDRSTPLKKFIRSIGAAFSSLHSDIFEKPKKSNLPAGNGERVKEREFSEAGKKLYRSLIASGDASQDQIFAHLYRCHTKGMDDLSMCLQKFLSK
jgi:ABC-type multidrug transport system ATPase subunit